jgi:hypothetical protein
MLNDLPREKLKFIIEEYGRSAIRDSNRCRELLRGLAPEHLRETNLLMLVLTEGFVWKLTSENLKSFAQRLHDEFGTQENFAVWAIESWALALNLIQQTNEIKPDLSIPQIKIIEVASKPKKKNIEPKIEQDLPIPQIEIVKVVSELAEKQQNLPNRTKLKLKTKNEPISPLKNESNDVYLYRIAAEKGNADAQFNLGFAYDEGEGVTQDYEQALFWYLKAAQQGDVVAQFNLGCMYHEGRGVARNYKQAEFFYLKAAEQGHDEAKNLLNPPNISEDSIKSKNSSVPLLKDEVTQDFEDMF